MTFEKDMRIAQLIDIYGDLLSQHRREIIEAYYFDDLSLSEISANAAISRQGARDSIKKSEAQLRGYEEKLGLSEKNAAFGRKKEELCSGIRALSEALCGLDPAEAADSLRRIADELDELSFLG